MGHTILLADDSITIQKVIELTFSDEDFELHTVGNGQKAIDEIRDVKPDIVLCDIIMPEKNGYEVCEFIKGNDDLKHIPVLLLTGAFEPFDQERAKTAGCDGFLAKPFEPQTLISKVRELLSNRSSAAPTAQLATPPEVVPPAGSMGGDATVMMDEPMAPPPGEPSLDQGFAVEAGERELAMEPGDQTMLLGRDDAPQAPAPPAEDNDIWNEMGGVSPPGPEPDESRTVMMSAPLEPVGGGFESVAGKPSSPAPPDSNVERQNLGGTIEPPLEPLEPVAPIPEPPMAPPDLPAAPEPPTGGGFDDLTAPPVAPEPEPPPIEPMAPEPAPLAGQFEPAAPFDAAEPMAPSEPPADALPSIEPMEPIEPIQPMEPVPPAQPAAPMTLPDEPSAFTALDSFPPAASAPSEPMAPVQPPPDEIAPAEPSAPPAPTPIEEPIMDTPAPTSSNNHIDDELVERIARRVVDKLSEKVVQEIVWEVVPDLAEGLIRREIDALKSEVEKSTSS